MFSKLTNGYLKRREAEKKSSPPSCFLVLALAYAAEAPIRDWAYFSSLRPST